MSEKTVSLNEQKYAYLKKLKLKFQKGHNEFVAACEFCGCKLEGSLRVSKFGNAYKIVTAGHFHHDQENNLHLYCVECHKRIHDWGVIQRWLRKVDKTVKDLPDSIGLAAWRKYGWG